MGRVRVRTEWVSRVRELIENNPNMGSRKIASVLEARFGAGAPSARTIDRIIKDHRGSEDRADFRYVYWPESFDRGDLSWEAAPVALELLRWNHKLAPPWPVEAGSNADDPTWAERAIAGDRHRYSLLDSGLTNRPTVRLVRWLHRVTQAATDSPFDWRIAMASHLDACDGLGNQAFEESMLRAVEIRLVTKIHVDFSVYVPTGTAEEESK